MTEKWETDRFITRLSQAYQPNARGLFRHHFLSMSSAFYRTIGQLSQAAKKNRIQFLHFHHLFEDEEQPFYDLLATLRRDYTFLSYSEAVERIWTGQIDGRYLAINFDDGFKNCLRACRILNEFAIKACIFVVVSTVGETNYQKIEAVCRQQFHMRPIEPLSWDDVETLLSHGHEIGSHTMTHRDLATLPVAEVETEIAQSFAELTRRIGSVKHFAWPYGHFCNFTPEAARIVFASGYQSCASTKRGSHTAQCDKTQLCIRRDHIIAKWPISHILYFLARSSRRDPRQACGRKDGWTQAAVPHEEQ